MSKHADIYKPETVEQYITKLEGRKATYKNRLAHVYADFLHFLGVEYKQLRFKPEAKLIRLPTHEKIMEIIANCGKLMATKLTLSLETGLRPCEIHTLKVKDIDLEHRTIYPTTAKGGSPRECKISQSLAQQIGDHIIRNNLNQNSQLFNGDAVRYGKEYREARMRTAKKLKDATILSVRLYDLRHYYATMLYHKTRDILYVKQQLGHRRIETTLIYTQLLNHDEEDAYTCKVAKDIKQATELIELGYEYVTEMENLKIFRKRK